LSEQQPLYRTSGDEVRAKGFTEECARAYYTDYVQFVLRRLDSPGGRLIDVGCGSGWSAYLFARQGFDTTEVDLNPASVEAPPADNLRFVRGDARALPFEDGAFDVVVTFQALEHVPDPWRALEEMLRLARPGGLVGVIGPNLLSPLAPVRAALVRLAQPARVLDLLPSAGHAAAPLGQHRPGGNRFAGPQRVPVDGQTPAPGIPVPHALPRFAAAVSFG
jgi:SAM-dependent methyltransferase